MPPSGPILAIIRKRSPLRDLGNTIPRIEDSSAGPGPKAPTRPAGCDARGRASGLQRTSLSSENERSLVS